MANPKVMQRSRSFPNRSEKHVRKNMFNLSHDHKTTFTMGKLIPFLCLETLPGDRFFIRAEVMNRFAPLYLPIMHRVNMELFYSFIPNRVMWPNIQADMSDGGVGWETFIFDVDSGLEHPYHEIVPYDGNDDRFELPMYLGFPSDLGIVGLPAQWQVNAFLMHAYYWTWDQFYRNDQLQDSIIHTLSAGLNPTYPFILSTGLPDLGYYCYYRNWNRDIFTSATNTPQVGSDVAIPLVDADFISPMGHPYGGPYRWLDNLTGTAVASTVLNAQNSVDAGHTESGLGEKLYLDIQETAAPIAALRFSLMLQEYQERNLRSGDRYSDRMDAFFDEDPMHGIIQVPQFIGAKYGRVVVSEVMSTTETATLKVGSYAGQAIALESSDIFEYGCQEHGIILGIISVYPDSSYMQGVAKKWTRTLSFDYAWEQFALIGDQAILNQEVNADIRIAPPDADYNTDVFGYNRRYYEYIYENDIVSGLMRTTFISFHLTRLLSVTDPEDTVLDSLFIQCRPDVTRVFQIAEGEDEIYAHIFNDVRVLRRLPKLGIPAV